MYTALVVGAQGVIGRNLIAHLETLPDWRIIGLSRRGGANTATTEHIAVDLLDARAARERLSVLTHVTHIFYAAYQDRPTWAELVPPNLAMLVNVVEAIEPIAPQLRHISLMQGYKVYGAHLGPFKTPAREDDPPHMPPEFNVDQQQYLERKQREAVQRQAGQDAPRQGATGQGAARQNAAWTWSAIRPAVVGGYALGNPMNLASLIAVYASIGKQLGLPLRFPGKPGAYDKLIEMTDAGLLARATVWAATSEASANQAYNINNGDLFRWSEMWPKIARYFGLDVAPPLPMSLNVVMADKAELWQRMQQEHGLAPHPYAQIAAWPFGDFVFSWDYDMFADGSKARRHGFHEFVETEQMFYRLFDEMRARKVIP